MPEIVPVKYVFLDVVGYSRRTRNAQIKIVEVLQEVAARSVADHRRPADHVVYLPTGDGMCIALVKISAPFDIHLRVALSILESLARHNEGIPAEDERRFDVRIGINAGEDILFKDINDKDNLAGAVINKAARVMGLAGPRQILVSESVYKDLHPDNTYAGSFAEYEATVKHGVEEIVYQFAEEGRVGLDTGPPAGLAHVIKRYDSRGDRKLKREICGRVEGARRRVWLLGVALADEVNLNLDLLRSLHSKVGAPGMDVKILLLDALRSPALFRAFLESHAGSPGFEDLVGRQRKRPRPDDEDQGLGDPYYTQPIYSSFMHTHTAMWIAMRDINPAYGQAVRYHGHTPVCWLVVTDDTAYYQPYTFGRKATADRQTLTIGNQMPVFKIQREADEGTFSVLEDHFRKLWLTSDSDLFHMGARIADRDRQLYLIFKKRHYWFKTVGAVLRNGKDKRQYPRQPCTSTGNVATVKWRARGADGAEEAAEVWGEIVDFSWVSVRLALSEKNFPAVGAVVRLELTATKPAVLAARYLFQELLRPTNHEFEVVWVDEEASELALWAVKRYSRGAAAEREEE